MTFAIKMSALLSVLGKNDPMRSIVVSICRSLTFGTAVTVNKALMRKNSEIASTVFFRNLVKLGVSYEVEAE